MSWSLRKAVLTDRDEIASLIAESVRGLSSDVYSKEQIELSITSVFGVDEDVINDNTYFVVETDGAVVGCGGWSRRKTLYGASVYATSRDPEFADPRIDASKIRAFFIHPKYARQGIGTAILRACEAEAKAHGFTSAEMMATLPGVKLYRKHGYTGDESVRIPVGEGVVIECIRMKKALE
jgi:GNAT superfamily N-acetyltransferase